MKGGENKVVLSFLIFSKTVQLIQMMIKMCTYKGTEEHLRMHDNVVDSLNTTGFIH